MADDRNDMDNSDYSLKWNNFTANLTCGFLSHLSEHELVDVTLAVEGKLLQAHKLVLSVCSPYFKEIFKVTPCKHPVVVLKDMGYSQVEALLRFMYKGEVNVSHHELASFLKIAETLKIKGLAGDQTNLGDMPSESKTSVHFDETLETDFDRATCSNTSTTEVHSKTSDGSKNVKRLRESTARSHSSTPKRSRASPPALKQMSYYNEGLDSVKTKSEPEDFDLPEDPYFIDQPLEQYLNSQQDSDKGFPQDEDVTRLAEQASNSLMSSPMCSQGGDPPQEQNGSREDRLYLKGFTYIKNKKSGIRTYWRCHKNYKSFCTARCVSRENQILRISGIHDHKQKLPSSLCRFAFNKKTVKGEILCSREVTRRPTVGRPGKIEPRRAELVEPVTYRLSARGRPQLVHEGYVYNLTSRSEVLNRSHYRCAEQHRGCRGKCAVIAERFMPTGVHEHNHPPGYQSEYDYRKKKGLDTDVI